MTSWPQNVKKKNKIKYKKETKINKSFLIYYTLTYGQIFVQKITYNSWEKGAWQLENQDNCWPQYYNIISKLNLFEKLSRNKNIRVKVWFNDNNFNKR